MNKKSPFRLQRHLIRPCIYQAATRLGVGLLLSLLWYKFANPSQLDLNSHAFFFMAVFFAAMAWLRYLRMDGMRIPSIKLKFLKKLVKKPQRNFADMSDYVDEEIVAFDDLDDEEKNVCLLYANIACALIFLVISFF